MTKEIVWCIINIYCISYVYEYYKGYLKDLAGSLMNVEAISWNRRSTISRPLLDIQPAPVRTRGSMIFIMR
jgi:hypothetical protein